MAQFAFDATQHQPSSVGVGQLPVSDKDGWPVVIRDSELKETKAKDGGYLELHLEIIDGPNKGATGVDRLNIFINSDEAKRIANQQLSAYCHVTGVYKLGNNGQKGCPELHNIPFRAVVGLQKGDNPNGYTEVKGVKDINGNDPSKAQPPAQQQASGAPTFQQPAQAQQQPQQPVQQQQTTPWGAQQQQAAPAQTTPWGGAAGNATAPWAAK